MTGTTPAIPICVSSSQHILELVGVGHVGHRAAGSQVGQDDLLMRRTRTSALSAMKCTPQNTM